MNISIPKIKNLPKRLNILLPDYRIDGKNFKIQIQLHNCEYTLKMSDENALLPKAFSADEDFYKCLSYGIVIEDIKDNVLIYSCKGLQRRCQIGEPHGFLFEEPDDEIKTFTVSAETIANMFRPGWKYLQDSKDRKISGFSRDSFTFTNGRIAVVRKLDSKFGAAFSWGDWERLAPLCVKNGTVTFTCKVCNNIPSYDQTFVTVCGPDGENTARFKWSGGTPPNYTCILPKEMPTKTITLPAELAKVIKMMPKFDDVDSEIWIDNEKIIFKSVQGQAVLLMPRNPDLEEDTIVLSARYLYFLMQFSEGKDTCLRFQSTNYPVFSTGPCDETVVLMPIRQR